MRPWKHYRCCPQGSPESTNKMKASCSCFKFNPAKEFSFFVVLLSACREQRWDQSIWNILYLFNKCAQSHLLYCCLWGKWSKTIWKLALRENYFYRWSDSVKWWNFMGPSLYLSFFDWTLNYMTTPQTFTLLCWLSAGYIVCVLHSQVFVRYGKCMFFCKTIWDKYTCQLHIKVQNVFNEQLHRGCAHFSLKF